MTARRETIISRKTLSARGLSPRKIAGMVESGALTRIRRDRYVYGTENEEHIHVAKMGARLTCVSAAKAYGLWTLEPPILHLWKSNADFSPQHTRKLIRPLPDGILVSLWDCVMHSLRCLPEREGLAIAESAVKSGRLAVEALLSSLPGNRNAKLRRIVEMIDIHSDSLPETFLRYALNCAGIEYEIQVRIDGVGIVDFLIEGWLIVEVDGYAFHSDRRAFRRDLKRNNAATIAGYRVLRFSFEDIVRDIDGVIKQIRAALALGIPWRIAVSESASPRIQ